MWVRDGKFSNGWAMGDSYERAVPLGLRTTVRNVGK